MMNKILILIVSIKSVLTIECLFLINLKEKYQECFYGCCVNECCRLKIKTSQQSKTTTNLMSTITNENSDNSNNLKEEFLLLFLIVVIIIIIMSLIKKKNMS